MALKRPVIKLGTFVRRDSIVKKKFRITAEIEFDCCNRTGKFKRNQSMSRTIVCRLLRFF